MALRVETVTRIVDSDGNQRLSPEEARTIELHKLIYSYGGGADQPLNVFVSNLAMLTDAFCAAVGRLNAEYHKVKGEWDAAQNTLAERTPSVGEGYSSSNPETPPERA